MRCRALTSPKKNPAGYAAKAGTSRKQRREHSVSGRFDSKRERFVREDKGNRAMSARFIALLAIRKASLSRILEAPRVTRRDVQMAARPFL
jgi:hypothetical protein